MRYSVKLVILGICFLSSSHGLLDPTNAPWLLFVRYSDPYQYPIATFDKTSQCSNPKGILIKDKYQKFVYFQRFDEFFPSILIFAAK